MGEFSYKAVDMDGHTVSGIVEAIDRRGAVAALAMRGRFVSDIIEKSRAAATAKAASAVEAGVETANAGRRFGSGRVTSKDIVAMTSQLSTALRAGLPILNAIQIIAEQQNKPRLKQLLLELAETVRGGDALSEAMSKHPDIFSKLYVSMVQVGETGGILDKTMIQLSSLLVRDEKIKTNMKNALAYPFIVLAAGIVSVIIMLTKVFPKMIDTIGGSVSLMPLPTRMLIGLSHFLVEYGWICAILLGGAVYLFIKWKRSPAGTLQWDTFLLKMPILGSVLRAIAVGRFARTLGALAKSGINILPALAVVRDTLGNELLGQQIDRVAEKVKTGQPVAEPLAESGLFPPLLIQIVNIGEQTGAIDELLLNAADTFDEESDAAITRFMAVFPALLIILLAVVIGFIIIATLLPIMSMDLGSIGV